MKPTAVSQSIVGNRASAQTVTHKQKETMLASQATQASTGQPVASNTGSAGHPRTVFGTTAIRNLQHVFVKKEFFNPADYEHTTSKMLPKQFRQLDPYNEKIDLLKQQTDLMDQALEDMKKNREEAKKQLEARFQDVYRKINNVRDFVVDEGKRINGTLLAFQNKYELHLDDLDKKHTRLHEELEQSTKDRFDKVDSEQKRLDSEIAKEREDRIRQNEESFARVLGKVQGEIG